MEDVVTEAPPPSRFFEEDLDNFSPKSSPLPSPILLRRNPNPNFTNLVIIAVAEPSIAVLRSVPNQILIGSIFLPEHPFLSTSPILIHSTNTSSTILVSIPCHVSSSRSRSVSKLLLDAFPSEYVVVFDDSSSSSDQLALKLETKEQRRKGCCLVKEEGVEWLGTGSVVEGFGAAVMGELEMRKRKGTMVVLTWQQESVGIVEKVVRDLGVEVNCNGGGGFVNSTTRSSSSNLYL